MLSLARVRAGDFQYWSIDYRMFDEFSRLNFPQFSKRRPVCFVSEAELLTASRTDYGKVLAERQAPGERLILEFREGGWEAFAALYPELAHTLVRIEVTAPDEAEAARLLEFARARLKEITGYVVSDEVYRETKSLVGSRLPRRVPPFGTILALWNAVPIEMEYLASEEVGQLRKGIADLDREKDEAVSLHKFEEAAQKRDEQFALTRRLEKRVAELRSSTGMFLSIESVRLSIEQLAGKGAPLDDMERPARIRKLVG